MALVAIVPGIGEALSETTGKTIYISQIPRLYAPCLVYLFTKYLEFEPHVGIPYMEHHRKKKKHLSTLDLPLRSQMFTVRSFLMVGHTKNWIHAEFTLLDVLEPLRIKKKDLPSTQEQSPPGFNIFLIEICYNPSLFTVTR